MKYTWFQSLYCEYKRTFVFKYPSLITWCSLNDRNNTFSGSILYVENYLLKVTANSDQSSEIESTLSACSHLPSFCCYHFLCLYPLPSSSFIKYLNPGWSFLGNVPALPYHSAFQNLKQMANRFNLIY